MPIGEIALREFTYDRPPGPRPPLEFLTNHFGLESVNVAIVGTELRCTVRCAFGAGEGGYTFRFGAPGYRDTTFTIADASFSRGVGSCPRRMSGGLVLDLELTGEQ
jgi:hypothetical protein